MIQHSGRFGHRCLEWKNPEAWSPEVNIHHRSWREENPTSRQIWPFEKDEKVEG
jgi:hypothetical protein